MLILGTMSYNNHMNNPDYKKEYDKMKRKFSIPKGENLKQMRTTEEGEKRYLDRKKKWDAFKKKWNILFFLKDKPVHKKKTK